MKIVKEHIEFQRNVEPKDSMNIGAWLDVRERTVLKGKDVSSLSHEERLNNYENFLHNDYFEIVNIEKDVMDRDQYHRKHHFDLKIETHVFRSLQDFEEAESYQFWVFRGSYEQFKNCFEIIKL